ncbi:hypothetical protein [Coralloluteibacterium thermophilus]|uniref:Uncharacterized protein n=1 Tax=Coralloluteibacterium thermophilum TaxID=2707049 RepID=A0ABV9NLG1_9GAMM
MVRFSAFLLAILLAPAHAEPMRARTAEDLVATRQQIERDLASDARYAGLAPDQRRLVERALDEMQALLEARGSIDALQDAEKVAFFNAQERANTTLANAAADSRMVCRRERRLGSWLPTNECHTLAERRRAAEQARDDHGRLVRHGHDVESIGAAGGPGGR